MTTVNTKIFKDLQSINPSAIIELFVLTLNSKLHYQTWEANRNYTVGEIVGSTNSGIVFKCTTAGISGDNQPSAFNTASAGNTISDNTVTWTAQSVDIYRFHSGSNLNLSGKIRWDSNDYLRFPIQASGFAFQKGQIPRPKIVISNGGLNTVGSSIDNLSISGLLLSVNQITTGNDLTGATITRIRTLAKFLDAENFPQDSNGNHVNPLGTPDNTAEFPKEIYFVDRKSVENREIVEFELAAPTDLAGVRVPGRQATRSLFPSIGTFIQ
tara:strand:- start:172 stop:978 length:807 start_codon:yes stop_codon:yes gene_type:complete